MTDRVRILTRLEELNTEERAELAKQEIRGKGEGWSATQWIREEREPLVRELRQREHAAAIAQAALAGIAAGGEGGEGGRRARNEERRVTRMEFRKQLECLINGLSKENGSDTPDFILAEYLDGCLANFDRAVAHREEWYGRKTRLGEAEIEAPDGAKEGSDV